MAVIFALDLGTTKFCMAKYDVTSGQFEKVSVKAEGMKKGMLSDLNVAKKNLNRLLDVAEDQFRMPINKVIVGIAGSHLSSQWLRKSFHPNGKIINQADLDNYVKSFSSSHLIDIIPVHYELDGIKKLKNPLGFHCEELIIECFGIVADSNYLKDVITLCNSIGIHVEDIHAEPYASSLMIPGVGDYIVVDIGGGTTDGIIYRQDSPVDLFNINVGSCLMSYDLMHAFQISYQDAESIKLRFGIEEHFEPFHLRTREGGSVEISPWKLHDVLYPRVLELCELVSSKIQSHRHYLSDGLYLTGGGASIKGIAQLFERVSELEVQVVSPIFNGEQLAPQFATISGLLKCFLEKKAGFYAKRSHLSKLIFHTRAWLKDIYR